MLPDTVVPGPVPAELVVVHTEAVAVAVGSVRAYLNGFEFTVHVRLRGEDDPFRHGMADPFERHGQPRQEAADQALRLGVLYADGRRAATTGRHPMLPDGTEAGGLVLLPGGSSGSDQRWDGSFWVHPLPPEGPVAFVISWLERGVPETRAEVDGGAILEAARRAVVLWPGEPDYEPSGSWASSTISTGEPGAPDAGNPPGQPTADNTGNG